tara:strand:+ start:341 stop:1087 length:747 start_codon:yes stop_codon:yes gene_type:complete
MTKRLLIGANDFGLFNSIDRGIIRSCKEGIIKNVAVVSSGKRLPLLRNLKKTDVDLGIQLNLTKGTPVSKNGVKSLLGKEGVFLKTGREVFLNSKIKEIEKEFYAQVEKAKKTFSPKWITCSDYLQNNPKIFGICLKIAQQENLAMRITSDWQKNAAREKNIKTPDYFLEDFYEEPGITVPGFLKILKNLKKGTTDLSCHPGSIEKGIIENFHYSWQREIELSTLINKKIKTFFDEEKSIQLLKFSNI